MKHSFFSLRDAKLDVDDICHGRDKNGKSAMKWTETDIAVPVQRVFRGFRIKMIGCRKFQAQGVAVYARSRRWTKKSFSFPAFRI
ncbi:MAG: hypothetical protein SPK75_15440 [Victivallales bacterium]|nr:hypothetical protein [bacterium]MDY5697761.1 hypothetical protein [Victivallales bacterium]